MKTYIPDTSAIIDGVLSELIEKKEIKNGKILVHNAVLAELEAQANKGRDIGFKGLDELKKLREFKSKKIDIEFIGERPKEFHIKYARSGEIDALIRGIAKDKPNSVFITLDKVDAKAAEAEGIEVMFIETEKIDKGPLSFEKYFDKKTMSVHLREGTIPIAKKGSPGNWRLEKVGKKRMVSDDLEKISEEIMENGKLRISGSFIEKERRGSVVAQIREYRIVITKPPFADGWEITIVRPVKKLKLKDYNLDKKVMELFERKAEGVLISGAPGNGKTTFAQAIAEFYLKKGKIVKTVEAPRDLRLPDEITQYSKALGSKNEIKDILLLSRPDYTLFDEMRNSSDFLLYSDMRLAGVGMIGVVHATSPIDAIQRFIKRVELGVIPSIIDTVIFIQNGNIGKIYSLCMKVKVPSGMTESDLARPVIEIKNFFTGNVEYEMYSFGESTVVMPVMKQVKDVEKQVKEEIKKIIKTKPEVDFKGGVVTVYVKKKSVKRVIGKRGKRISSIEKKVGVPIEVIGY